MRFVPVTPSGASVAVLDLGAGGPARVYLGGLGSASTVAFAEVAGHPALAGTGRHVLIDLIGSGWSDHDDAVKHTIDEHAETVIALARWSPRGLHRTSVSLLAERPATFREQFAAFPGPRRYISGELSREDLDPLRATGCDVRVIPAAAHELMSDNLDGFVAALPD